MRLIDKFSSKAELESYLRHVGEVRESDNQGLRRGNLEKHVAKLLGVADWNTALGMVSGTVAKTECKMCSLTLMPNGYCPDQQCIHHLCTQDSKGHEDDRRLTIHTQFRSDDGKFAADFDATPYFEHLIAEYPTIAPGYLERLFMEEGSGCTVADDVARTFADSPSLLPYTQHPEYSIIKMAFDYFDTPLADDTGFEVYVHMEDLSRWLVAHHPDLYYGIPEYARGFLDIE